MDSVVHDQHARITAGTSVWSFIRVHVVNCQARLISHRASLCPFFSFPCLSTPRPIPIDCPRSIRHLCGDRVRARARAEAPFTAKPARPERRRQFGLTHRLRHFGVRGDHRSPPGRLHVLRSRRVRSPQLEATKLYVTPSLWLISVRVRQATGTTYTRVRWRKDTVLTDRVRASQIPSSSPPSAGRCAARHPAPPPSVRTTRTTTGCGAWTLRSSSQR